MNAPMYAEADQSAPARPIIANGPARLSECCNSLIAVIRMSRPCPGTIVLMLSISVWVAEGPNRPSTAVSTITAGKIDNTL
jgi:hypothetical protein